MKRVLISIGITIAILSIVALYSFWVYWAITTGAQQYAVNDWEWAVLTFSPVWGPLIIGVFYLAWETSRMINL